MRMNVFLYLYLYVSVSSALVTQHLSAMQVLILVAAALITTVTNKILYYFALYTNYLERCALPVSAQCCVCSHGDRGTLCYTAWLCLKPDACPDEYGRMHSSAGKDDLLRTGGSCRLQLHNAPTLA